MNCDAVFGIFVLYTNNFMLLSIADRVVLQNWIAMVTARRPILVMVAAYCMLEQENVTAVKLTAGDSFRWRKWIAHVTSHKQTVQSYGTLMTLVTNGWDNLERKLHKVAFEQFFNNQAYAFQGL